MTTISPAKNTLVFSYKYLIKAKIKGVLAVNTVAMVIYYAPKLTATCSPMIIS